MTRLAVFRILDTRRRRQAKAWAARAEIVAAQLRVLRTTYP